MGGGSLGECLCVCGGGGDDDRLTCCEHSERDWRRVAEMTVIIIIKMKYLMRMGASLDMI